MSIHSDEIAISSIPDFDRRTANGALRASRNVTNLALIGSPRGTFTAHCAPPQNPDFIAMVETVDFGPFRATGLRPALQSLTAILADIQVEQPDIFSRLGTEGMLCCRLVTGSSTAISNHSWGTAIDLTLDGKLDQRGDGRVQRGLLNLWPIFNRHGFYWGIAFPIDDSMHFEASDQLVRQWAADGALGPQSGKPVPRALTIGDRGPAVAALQVALNVALKPLEIAPDGIFGTDTRAAVITLQRRSGLSPDGTATDSVLHLLGLK